MSLQIDRIDHINVKIFARGAAHADLEAAIPMFHRWIQESLMGELLIDVADYRHVPDGPGVMLIGHEANYSLDLAFSRLGLLYNRKAVSSGTLAEKLQSAYASALAACALVEEESAFRGKLEFDAGNCEIIFNDRLLAPNSAATWGAIAPTIHSFLQTMLGNDAYRLESIGEPRERLRLAVQAQRFVPVSALLDRSAALQS